MYQSTDTRLFVCFLTLTNNTLVVHLIIRIQRRRRSSRPSCRGSNQARCKRGLLQGIGGETVVAQEKVGKCSGGRTPEGAVNPAFIMPGFFPSVPIVRTSCAVVLVWKRSFKNLRYLMFRLSVRYTIQASALAKEKAAAAAAGRREADMESQVQPTAVAAFLHETSGWWFQRRLGSTPAATASLRCSRRVLIDRARLCTLVHEDLRKMLPRFISVGAQVQEPLRFACPYMNGWSATNDERRTMKYCPIHNSRCYRTAQYNSLSFSVWDDRLGRRPCRCLSSPMPVKLSLWTRNNSLSKKRNCRQAVVVEFLINGRTKYQMEDNCVLK